MNPNYFWSLNHFTTPLDLPFCSIESIKRNKNYDELQRKTKRKKGDRPSLQLSNLTRLAKEEVKCYTYHNLFHILRSIDGGPTRAWANLLESAINSESWWDEVLGCFYVKSLVIGNKASEKITCSVTSIYFMQEAQLLRGVVYQSRWKLGPTKCCRLISL